jgi:hypothetical protein
MDLGDILLYIAGTSRNSRVVGKEQNMQALMICSCLPSINLVLDLQPSLSRHYPSSPNTAAPRRSP